MGIKVIVLISIKSQERLKIPNANVMIDVRNEAYQSKSMLTPPLPFPITYLHCNICKILDISIVVINLLFEK